MFKIKLAAKAERELKKLSKEDRLSIGEVIEELIDMATSAGWWNR